MQALHPSMYAAGGEDLAHVKPQVMTEIRRVARDARLPIPRCERIAHGQVEHPQRRGSHADLWPRLLRMAAIIEPAPESVIPKALLPSTGISIPETAGNAECVSGEPL